VKTNVELSLDSCVTVLDLTSRKTINLPRRGERERRVLDGERKENGEKGRERRKQRGRSKEVI